MNLICFGKKHEKTAFWGPGFPHRTQGREAAVENRENPLRKSCMKKRILRPARIFLAIPVHEREFEENNATMMT